MLTNKLRNKILLILSLGAFLLSSCGKPNNSSTSSDSISETSGAASSDTSGTSGETSSDTSNSTSSDTSNSTSSDTSANTSTNSSSETSSTSIPDTGNYYNSISESATGTTLLGSLRTLNSNKRTKTVGYSNMGKHYKQTDGDPNNSNNIISFYSGNSAYFSGQFTSGNAFNREHVWPNSRGGSAVEADIHVIRPTLTSENSSRGNSFFVEGMTSSSSGWDPGAVSWGDDKYRGIVARIVFYSVVASSNLKLVDLNNDGTGNNSMGKLSDLLKWNLQYGIDETEIQRNEAIITIQGNRNPFIDRPDYACKIWGSTNAATKTICGIA